MQIDVCVQLVHSSKQQRAGTSSKHLNPAAQHAARKEQLASNYRLSTITEKHQTMFKVEPVCANASSACPSDQTLHAATMLTALHQGPRAC
jgi:hypothetical protein